MPDYKFDRTAFKMQTFAEADKANIFDSKHSVCYIFEAMLPAVIFASNDDDVRIWAC